jgi:hypothetical protein
MTPPAGKTFTGWKTEEIIYYPGAGFTVNADASFAAQWNSSTNINDPFVDFYNYPNGRVDQGASWK